MAYNHTLQERYSALVDAKLRYNLIKRNGAIFNTRYEGNPKAGAVKIPVRDTEVTAAAYDATSGAQLTAGATNYLTVNINKDYAVNELIDNYEAAAVPDNLVADRLDSAAYSLALQMEQDATAELESGSTASSGITAVAAPKVNGAVTVGATQMAIDGTTLTGKLLAGETITIGNNTYTVAEDTAAAATNAIAVVKIVGTVKDAISDNADVTINGLTAPTSANIYGQIVDARTWLSANKVPTTGRFLLVSPAVYALLLKDNTYFVHATQAGDNVIASGAVGRIAGFDVFEDPTLSANVHFIAGHPDWCTRVEEWQVPVHVQDLSGSGKYIGASAVQGRRIYAHKVTKAKAVYRKVTL